VTPDRRGNGDDAADDSGQEQCARGAEGGRSKKTISNLPSETRTALGKQGAAVARRKRTGASGPKTRAELYEMAKRRGLPGRSSMGRDELARRLGQK
jgi:hypothetical protein